MIWCISCGSFFIPRVPFPLPIALGCRILHSVIDVGVCDPRDRDFMKNKPGSRACLTPPWPTSFLSPGSPQKARKARRCAFACIRIPTKNARIRTITEEKGISIHGASPYAVSSTSFRPCYLKLSRFPRRKKTRQWLSTDPNPQLLLTMITGTLVKTPVLPPGRSTAAVRFVHSGPPTQVRNRLRGNSHGCLRYDSTQHDFLQTTLLHKHPDAVINAFPRPSTSQMTVHREPPSKSNRIITITSTTCTATRFACLLANTCHDFIVQRIYHRILWMCTSPFIFYFFFVLFFI